MPELSVDLIKTIALVATFAAISVSIYVSVRSRVQRSNIRAGLDDAMLINPSVAESRTVVMSLPFGQRIMSPATRRIAGLAYRFGPQGMAQRIRERLILAGLGDRIDADTFMTISVVAPVVVLALLVTYTSTGGSVPNLVWTFVPASAMFPKMWLTSKVESRQHSIRLALPDVLDLLTIAVEAGLGFDAALARVVSSVRGPLSDEMYRMLQEVRIGVPRAQALKSLSDRTKVQELDQFITAINQADSFGISIGRVLRVQAAQLRIKRSQIAEEKAAKTPVKLLFPLIFCIFPALFVVIVGPAAIQIMNNLFTNL
jgi:tight adherence protein C